MQIWLKLPKVCFCYHLAINLDCIGFFFFFQVYLEVLALLENWVGDDIAL